MKESARIDKWLWAARIYKTRSIAADACKNGRVMVGGVTRKPSFIIKRGDVVSVKKAPYHLLFRGSRLHRAARRRQDAVWCL